MLTFMHYLGGFFWGLALAGVVYSYILRRQTKKMKAHHAALLEFLEAIQAAEPGTVTITVDKRKKKVDEHQ